MAKPYEIITVKTNISVAPSGQFLSCWTIQVPLTVTLSNNDAVADGTEITIKDETGNASVNNIIVNCQNNFLIENSQYYTINADNGLIQLIKKGKNYSIVGFIGAKSGGTGNVMGPSSSSEFNIASYADSSGKIIADSGVNVNNVPSSDQSAALVGTSGMPSSTNKYVTDQDPRLSGGGSRDVVSPNSSISNDIAIFADNTGLVIKDSDISINNIPTDNEAAALVGSYGLPSINNPYVTSADPRLSGGGGSLNKGIATLYFGPMGTNNVSASITITGQTSITSTSIIQSNLLVEATQDHTFDEVLAENIRIRAGNIIPGTGFTIYSECTLGTTYGHFNTSWLWE